MGLCIVHMGFVFGLPFGLTSTRLEGKASYTGGTNMAHLGQIIDSSGFQVRYIPDLYDPAHLAAWEPYNLHGLAPASWVGCVLYRSCTLSHGGRLGCRFSIS